MTKRTKPTAFVEHPITSDEKFEITSAGFKIVDINFKPKKLADGDKVIAKPKAKPKAK